MIGMPGGWSVPYDRTSSILAVGSSESTRQCSVTERRRAAQLSPSGQVQRRTTPTRLQLMHPQPSPRCRNNRRDLTNPAAFAHRSLNRRLLGSTTSPIASLRPPPFCSSAPPPAPTRRTHHAAPPTVRPGPAPPQSIGPPATIISRLELFDWSAEEERTPRSQSSPCPCPTLLELAARPAEVGVP